MKKIEDGVIGQFAYTRYQLASKTLGKDVNFGLLRLKQENGTERAPCGTVYLFHGGNGDDRQAVDVQLPLLIQDDVLQRFADQNLQIALPFIGTSFLNGNVTDHVLSEIMPLAESGTTTTDKTRYVTGFSMGGQSALNLFFRYPERFAGVGAHFATLIGFDYLNAEQIEAFTKRTGITNDYLQVLISGFTAQFPTRQQFESYDPVSLASATSEKLTDKKIYFDVGSKDEFGLHEGADLLNQTLQDRGIKHHYEKVSEGKHDAPFIVAQFAKMLRFVLS